MCEIKRIKLTPAKCAVDLGDGSERGFYVNQDYILNELGRPHRGISLMYCYYPLDKEWPLRAQDAFKDQDVSFAWDYPYDNYFPYTGGLNGDTDSEVFKRMQDIRKHGQDVVLTLTVDPNISDDHIIAIAKDLRPYGRVLLRMNHECTGDWFSFTKRASYQQIADFFVRFTRIIKEYAPNVKMILCAGAVSDATAPKIEKEDEFVEAVRATDIFSMDQYMALNWGWPYEVAEEDNNQHQRSKVSKVYENTRNTFNRLVEICNGERKPMVMSELNADGDVTGAYDQAAMVREFCDMIKNDPEQWFSAFTMYQFRDDGRLGLEITDPNNSEVGIKQPLFYTYKEIINDDFFKPGIVEVSDALDDSAAMTASLQGNSTTSGTESSSMLPVCLRWGGAEDAEGIAMELDFESDPVFAEAYFEDELIDTVLMMELNGRWFYKAKGVKCIDFMPAFYNKRLSSGCKMNLNIFAPPQDGVNDKEHGRCSILNGLKDKTPECCSAQDSCSVAENAMGQDDWDVNYYFTLKSLPKIRLRFKPIVGEV